MVAWAGDNGIEMQGPVQADLVARLRGCVKDRENLVAVVEDWVLDLKTQEKKTKRDGALINAALYYFATAAMATLAEDLRGGNGESGYEH